MSQMIPILLVVRLTALGAVASGQGIEDEIVPQAFAWPEPGRTTRAKVQVQLTPMEKRVGRTAVRVDYDFPDAECRQVVVDFPIRTRRCYGQLGLWVKGDASGNKLVVWLGAAGGWFGQGSVSLTFTGWRQSAWPVTQTDTDVADTLRVCIVQQGGLGRHSILLDGLELTRPAPPKVNDLHVFGGDLPATLKDLPDCPKRFRVRLVRNDDRTVLLLDGQPLFCVLGVRFDPAYLREARVCGVNCFALDLYWRHLEPRKGYREWDRLRRQLSELRRLGFGVILLVGPHQPTWWTLDHPDLPGASQGNAYVLSPDMKRDFGKLVRELVGRTRGFPNVLGYMISAGGEQDSSFPEVLGQPGRASPWRRDPTCLEEYRRWLKQRYCTRAAFRRAWHDVKADFKTATPPPREERDDYRQSWLDWAEFATGWWVRYADWVASVVRPLAPHKLLVARFGWPVFQAENVFLARQSDFDLIQCKDGVASWEVGHPGKQLSRTAMYYGALRHSAKVVFPEMDIIHGRGYHVGDLSHYVPLFARFGGALWYYRGLLPRRPDFVDDLREAVQAGKHLVSTHLGSASVGVFRSETYANAVSVHRNYENESALVGAAELFTDLKRRYALVSEFTLPDLFDFNLVVIPYNPAVSANAERALEGYLRLGGTVIMEANTGEFDLHGRRRSKGTLQWAPVRVMATKAVHGLIDFGLHGPGLTGKLTLEPGLREWTIPDADSETVGVYNDSVMASRRRVLYIPCRFFAPYSYDHGSDRAGMRRLVEAFCSKVAPEQRALAKKALARANANAKSPPALSLVRQADEALQKERFVRTVYLARLADAVEPPAAAPDETRLPGVEIVVEQVRSWVKADLGRLRRLRRVLNLSPDELEVPFALAEHALAASDDSARKATASESVLALVTLAHDALTEAERKLKSPRDAAND